MQGTIGADNTKVPGVVILGAGFAGLSAAKKLIRAIVPFTLIDQRNYHLFQPLLYQVAMAALSPSDVATPIRSLLSPRANKIGEILMDSVQSVDKDARIVTTRGGASVPYSELIVATGSEFTYFGNDEKWGPHAHPLKTLDDALDIRRRVLLAFERAETTNDAELRERLMTFVIVGGGPTGVETAGALAELANATLANDFINIDTRKTRIVLVEALDSILSGYPDHLSQYAKKKLEQMGVEIRLEDPVKDVNEDGVVLESEPINSANVFWCAGIKATPVGEWLGVKTEKNGSIAVGDDLTVPEHPEIYVLGDASKALDADGNPFPALAPVAKQQGAYAAKAIIAARRGEKKSGRFRYRDWGTMATIGRAAAVGTFGKLEIKGFVAWLAWGFVHVLYLTGFRSRVSVALNWLWSWATYAKGARLITGPDIALVTTLDSVDAVEKELDLSTPEAKQQDQEADSQS